MRAFLSWHWLSQTSWFSCKLTLLMIRCDHDCGDDLDSSHENFAFDKHPWIGVGDGAVQRKEHHRVPGHHLHHARRLPYAQLWHSRPRVHSNKEVKIRKIVNLTVKWTGAPYLIFGFFRLFVGQSIAVDMLRYLADSTMMPSRKNSKGHPSLLFSWESDPWNPSSHIFSAFQRLKFQYLIL